MSYRSGDLNGDLSRNKNRVKRVIFYSFGLKVYGIIPYILCRRLKGQFISNYWVADEGAFFGAGVMAPTCEANYTAIPYGQTPENSRRLWDWLLTARGFEYGISAPEHFARDIWQANVGQYPPDVWVPGKASSIDSFSDLIQGQCPVDEASTRLKLLP